MSEYGRLPRRLGDVGRGRTEIVHDVDEEIAFHLEMRTRELMESGLSEASARDRALSEFGDVGALRSWMLRFDVGEQRRRRWWAWLADVRQDVRFALRSFRRTPLFTAVALATLILGIGASVAIFTVVDAVVLRPLPYPAAERLVRIAPGRNFNVTLAERLSAVPSVAVATGIAMPSLTLTGQGEAAELSAQAVGEGFFDVFGVRPAPGRAFTLEEREAARSDVAILSHELWQTRFGGDPAVIGKRVQLDGYGHATREVIGVMPRGFVAPIAGANARVDLWVPLLRVTGRTIASDNTWYVSWLIARLQPGATVTGATQEVRGAMARARADEGGVIQEAAVRTASVMSLQESMVGDVRGPLLVLLSAVGLVLLLACANLANLLLARGDRRRHELALRTALGGTRGRLVRELLTESAVLAALGGAGGVVLAGVILRVLNVAEASRLPRLTALSIDARVVLFACLVTTLSLVLFALPPALRATLRVQRLDLGSGGRTAGRTRARGRLGAALIAGEVALAMVLVSGAGLLLNSLRAVRSVEPGLDASDVLSLRLSPPPSAFNGERALVFYDQVLERLAALPGVRGVGAVHLLPFTSNNWRFPYLADGHEPPANAPLPSANFRVVTPGYFDAVDVPLLAGRAFDGSDRADGAAVGMINRRLAEMLWPGEAAVGRVIQLFGNRPFRVVGVVGDVHQHALDSAPEPEMYLPLQQWPVSEMVVMLEADPAVPGIADAAMRSVWSVESRVPIQAAPLEDVLGATLAQRAFFAGVLTFFATLALVLGAVGVYGVMTYAVAARLPEFGVRLALGATGQQVLRTALAQGLWPAGLGLVAGTAVALSSGKLLRSALYGVTPTDVTTLAGALLVMSAVALLACWLPARHARRVDPMRMLKAE